MIVAAARAAQPAWAATTVVRRGEILRNIAFLMRERRDAIARLVAREVEALYTNGPAGGGGATISVRPILAMRSTLIPRHLVTPRVDLLEIA